MFRKLSIVALVLASACSPTPSADVVDAGSGADVPCDVYENGRLCNCPNGAQGLSLCVNGVWAECDCNFIDSGTDTGPRDAGTDAAMIDSSSPRDAGNDTGAE